MVHKSTTVGAEQGTGLLVYAAHNDSLLHALERHAKQEQPCNLEIAGQIHEDFPQSCDLALPLCLRFGERRRHRECTSLLQILNSIADVAILRGLDGSTKNLLWLILVPKFDLEDQLLQWAPLHLGLGILRD